MDINSFLLGLLVGTVVGILLKFALLKSKLSPQTRLADEIDHLKKSHQDYQSQVNRHFEQSAALIDQLNESQQAVNFHLTQGLENLVSHDYRIAMMRQAEHPQLNDDSPSEPPSPRDYADKAPGTRSSLSAEYNANRDQ